MSLHGSIGPPSSRICAAARVWLSLAVVACGGGLVGCGRSPAPLPVVEATPPVAAPVEPQYYKPPHLLPAVTGNGKSRPSTKTAKADEPKADEPQVDDAKADEVKADEVLANDAKTGEAETNDGPGAP